MTRAGDDVQAISCQCGQVALEAEGKPIVATICDCSSCRDAGRRLKTLQAQRLF